MSRQSVGPTQPPTHWVLGVEWPEPEDDHSPAPNVEVKNGWNGTANPCMPSWHVQG